MKNKSCDKMALEKVLAQYIHKNTNRSAAHPTHQPEPPPSNDKFRRTFGHTSRVFSKMLSHHNSMLQTTQQKQPLPSKFDQWLIQVKMPLSSRLFSHEDDGEGFRKDSKELKHELLQDRRREFYGKANLRIRQLKKQEKREQFAHNEKFRMLFNRGPWSLQKHHEDSFSKTLGVFNELKGSREKKVRVNSTIVVLREERRKVGMSKTGLQFYRTLYS